VTRRDSVTRDSVTVTVGPGPAIRLGALNHGRMIDGSVPTFCRRGAWQPGDEGEGL
jgi:hypothetical protein